MPPKKNKELVVIEGNGHLNELVPDQGRRVMEAMNGAIPEHAKDVREGRGDKVFTYIKHGYVAETLNQVFGPFWDWELRPVHGADMYSIIEYESGGKPAKEVAVVGILTIRIYNEVGVLLETIRRTGEGGKVWEKNTTFADAIQSASSDAFKRAAFRLGKRFGLELYYDDEDRQEVYRERMGLNKPATIGQLLRWVAANNVSDEEFTEVIGHDVSESTEKEVSAIWERLVTHRQGVVE